MTPRIWTYWEGPRPPWINLCLRTIERNIPGVEVLTPESWAAMYDGRDVPRETLDRQRPNVKSDFIRAWLLHRIGGIWIDADAIVFRDVRPIWGRLQTADFAAYRVLRPNPQLCTALMAATPNSRIGERYYRLMVAALADGRRLATLAIGPRVLMRARRETPEAELALAPNRLVHPIHWQRAKLLRARAGTWRPDPEAYCCMLTHRALGPLRQWPADELIGSDTVAGECFRLALTAPSS